MEAQNKNQQVRARTIKQRLQHEGNKKIWYQIKQTVQDPQSPSVLRVQQVIDEEVQEFKEPEEVENVIQRDCKVRFTLAHSAPIMRTLLRDKLSDLSDKEITKKIITGTYVIQEETDPATKLILEEIG